MTRIILILIAACALGPAPGYAQTTGTTTGTTAGVPAMPEAAPAVLPGRTGARNGNVYNGTAHEPSAPSVNSAERSAGVAPSQQKVQQEDQELERLNKQLQQQNGVAHPAPLR